MSDFKYKVQVNNSIVEMTDEELNAYILKQKPKWDEIAEEVNKNRYTEPTGKDTFKPKKPKGKVSEEPEAHVGGVGGDTEEEVSGITSGTEDSRE